MSTTIAAEQVAQAAPRRPGYFGDFGGQFVPEVLMPAIQELEVAYTEARDDPLIAHHRIQPLGDLLQQLVAGFVTQRVIDLLEPVEIKREQGERQW